MLAEVGSFPQTSMCAEATEPAAKVFETHCGTFIYHLEEGVSVFLSERKPQPLDDGI